jgi:hypothetical protein
MAVALILDFPGGTKAQYDAVIEQMELGGKMPAGGMFHAAGSYEGGWRVIDVWDDIAPFEAFRAEKIGPLSAAAGMAPPGVRVVQVHEQKQASGRRAELVQVVTMPGLDGEGFAALDARVLPDGRSPEHMTFHVNGPADGGWCVVDGWDSKEERDRFLEERIRPAAEGAPLTGAPVVEDLVVHGTLDSRAPTGATA